MIFNSIPFLLFFPIVILLYYLMPQRVRYIWLLICSYFFYFSQSTSFVSLLILSTLTTFIAGLLLYKTDNKGVKNAIVALAVLINIGILFFVKYIDGVLELIKSPARFNLFLPIGISFYTFQAISYVIDCYRHKTGPEKNILRYALYVSFFPSLLSGPINRAQDLLPELKCDTKLDLENLKCGMQKMLWGYFLKLVIAARLTIVVDNVYSNVDGYSGSSIMIAAIFYLFMLYCDFEGYSQMAIGAARILGIRMKENFAQPFYSLSMSELWRRWHISLSTWLREYIYFPLGGNRKGTIRKYVNVMIIFIVSGLWHGITWNYIIWGCLNGLFVVMGGVLTGIRNELADKIGLSKHTKIRMLLQRIGVYCLYGFTMIFFANNSLGNAILAITGIFTRFGLASAIRGEVFGLGLGFFNLIFSLVMVVAVLVMDGFCYRYSCDFSELMKKIPTVYRWALYLGIVILILFSANLTGKEFIYSTM